MFLSIARRILIGHTGYTEMQFGLAFATAAIVMAVTARFAGAFVARWGIDGCVERGMALLMIGAATLAAAWSFGLPGFATLVPPMWIMAVGSS